MVYLDYAATAKPVIHVSDYIYNDWMNVNSYYSTQEKNRFKECEERVKRIIGAKSGKVIFGGNASWFFEKLYGYKSNYWLCGYYEHDCVNKNGVTSEYEQIMDFENEIYCHQMVNNITGEIFRIDEIGKYIKNENGYFICDATAGIGKAMIPDNIDDWCDCLVASSHKIGVDNKQIGFAWISDRFHRYIQLQYGVFGNVVNGYGWVDGTPDLACAIATTEAMVLTCNNVEKYNHLYNNLSYYLETQLNKNNIEHSYVFSMEYTNAINPIILNNIKADTLCNYLATVHQVYISPGHSACEENSDYRVLQEYALTQEGCESTIRVSFGPDTTKEDINALINGIVEFKEKFCND